MKLCDHHLHSEFSDDSETELTDIVEQALHLGMSEICITDHHDIDYPKDEEGHTFLLDTGRYISAVRKLQEQYKDKLTIRLGVELGLMSHIADKIIAYTDKYHDFDFIIGSSHLVYGKDPYYPAYYEGRSEKEALLEYFESILENLHAFSEMDVYGHIDYIVRYGPNQNKYYTYERYQDILDEILRTVIARGRGIELNTGGFHYGLGEPNPCRAVIRRYRELGGEIITVGADAHGPEKIAYDFDKAAAILADCGFKYYTVFQNRKPEFVKL